MCVSVVSGCGQVCGLRARDQGARLAQAGESSHYPSPFSNQTASVPRKSLHFLENYGKSVAPGANFLSLPSATVLWWQLEKLDVSANGTPNRKVLIKACGLVEAQ